MTTVYTHRALVRNQVFIPREAISLRDIKKNYEFDVFKDQVCSTCSNLPYRPNEVCEPCDAYGGRTKLWTRQDIKGDEYIGVPVGNLKKVAKRLRLEDKGIELVEQRKTYPFLMRKIRWTGSMYSGKTIKGRKTADQVSIVKKWMEKKNGMIVAPPRTGKTVLGCNISTAGLRQRTLIIAHQDDLLKNFNVTFVGSKKENKKAMTNIPQLRRKTGKRICGIVNSVKELYEDDLDIAMITYQKLLPKGTDLGAAKVKKLIKFLNANFSFLIVDEAHSIAAECYADLISKFKMRHRLTLTATPERKDGKSRIVFDTMGPKVVESQSTSLLPQITLLETGLAHKQGYKHDNWTSFVSYISADERRNRVIVKQVFADMRAGHTIIIPVTKKDHMNTLVDMINRQAKINNIKKGEKWPKKTAVAFQGVTKNRRDLLTAVDQGEHRVVVAIYSIMKQGIDMTSPSALYVSTPTSNPAMFYQLSNRVCTYTQDKPQPIVRLLIDNYAQSTGCFRVLFWKEIQPKLRDDDRAKTKRRYVMAPHDVERSFAISRNRKTYTPEITGTVKGGGVGQVVTVEAKPKPLTGRRTLAQMF